MGMVMIVFGTDQSGQEELRDILRRIPESLIFVENEDYITVSHKVCRSVHFGSVACSSRGIIVCGTGAGVTICANKHKGIYAVACYNLQQAKNARVINNANVLCLASQTGGEINKQIVQAFLETPYENRKPERLVAIKLLEKEQFK